MFRPTHLASRAAFALVLVGATGSVARADLSRGVISAFHGQLVVSKDQLPEGKNDHDTISKIRAAEVKVLQGTPQGDVQQWHFHYTAFLTRGGSTTLKLDFLRPNGELAADQSLDSVDPKSSVLTGDIAIDEDDGLTKGKTYTVELIAGGSQVVAKTTLTVK